MAYKVTGSNFCVIPTSPQKLLNRPQAFHIGVDSSKGKLVVNMNPFVAAHRAAAMLGGEDAKSIKVDYTLEELSSVSRSHLLT
jgi:hypothetical protein